MTVVLYQRNNSVTLTIYFMKHNHALQADIHNAPQRAPIVNAPETEVTAGDAAVSPKGILGSHSSKSAVERATQKLVGSKTKFVR